MMQYLSPLTWDTQGLSFLEFFQADKETGKPKAIDLGGLE